MLTLCIADAERDVGMKNLSRKEAITILESMRVDIPVPKAAVTQKKRNVALDMAISALSCSEIPNSSDSISRQAAIDAVKKHYRTHDNDLLELIAFDIERLPPAQGKPFNLPEIYIADGYDTIEGEDGNIGFGVYVPDENQIYVAGDVEGEIRARALLHEICHWVQAMCGRPFDEDEANEFSDIIYDALPSAQPEIIRCKDCKYWKRSSCCEGYCGEIDMEGFDEDHYCGFAERRTE